MEWQVTIKSVTLSLKGGKLFEQQEKRDKGENTRKKIREGMNIIFYTTVFKSSFLKLKPAD